MRSESVSPVLVDAAAVLSDQLRSHFRRLAKLLRPHAKDLDARFLARLQELHFERRQRRALAALTPGAAARIVLRGRPLADFLEQVEYNGRRLAKLNLPPSDIVEALAEYDRLLAPFLHAPAPAGLWPDGEAGRPPPGANPAAVELPGPDPDPRFPLPPPWETAAGGYYQWVREQLHFCVILTLNRAYYEVREAEAETFYELFRAELEARNLDQLLENSLAALARFCGAREANLFLLNEEGSAWVRRASVGLQGHRPARDEPLVVPRQVAGKRLLERPRSVRAGGRSAQVLLDPGWPGRFASAWSVPLISAGRPAGVMQFGFRNRYDWLPREQELLEAAAERCLVAAEKARLVEDLAAREEQIRQLAEHMLHVEEVERRRISRELHDEAGQSLLYIRLQLEMLEKEFPERFRAAKEKLAEIRRVSEHTILEIRRLIAALSPAVLEQLGLAAALRQLVSRFRQLYPCRLHLHLSHLRPLPKRMEAIVYRLVQECCNNIAKHSQASNVNISVRSADGILRLEVEDDGVGFKVTEALEKKNSFGLAGMRERVTLLGGNLEIESHRRSSSRTAGGRRHRTGTRITAELPILRGE